MSISIREIKKSFGFNATPILKGISAEIETGEMVSITGRSGSGKSTLLYIISSLDRPTSGDVLIDDKSLLLMNSKDLHQFRNQKMGFVFQFHHLLPELTAVENVLMPALKTKSAEQHRQFAMELLEEFGLKDRMNHLPSQLSGGEQQRVAVARALVMQPTYLFADEPTGNLDSVNGLLVMGLFKRINKEQGTTIIYVTHDQEFARMSSHQINLVDGSLMS
ncbi:MAG TPA: ABC transporter ATP-binding protein [Pseudobdellovibrionaceae bacterium]|jgi:putative ABC transport system ATP-binding protein/lipoprotein-releasing system ATP-binding protein